jgi:hypothetical protein
MTDLFASLNLASTVAGVENFVAEILSILVAASENHGLGPFSSTARDPSDPRPVYTSLREVEARGETTPFGISWHVTKDPFCHQVLSEVAE